MPYGRFCSFFKAISSSFGVRGEISTPHYFISGCPLPYTLLRGFSWPFRMSHTSSSALAGRPAFRSLAPSWQREDGCAPFHAPAGPSRGRKPWRPT